MAKSPQVGDVLGGKLCYSIWYISTIRRKSTQVSPGCPLDQASSLVMSMCDPAGNIHGRIIAKDQQGRTTHEWLGPLGWVPVGM